MQETGNASCIVGSLALFGAVHIEKWGC